MEEEDMKLQVERFMEEYAGTAIGESVARRYENGTSIEDIYSDIEGFGY